MKLQDITESRPIPTHKYYFSGLDHKTASDYNYDRKRLYPYQGGYYMIKYNTSGQPFFEIVRQLKNIVGDPIIEKI